jgi:hypothetical protein
MTTATITSSVSTRLEPCRDAAQLREYIDTHWRKGHVLARDERMFKFQYCTPWVDRKVFPSGISALCLYDDDSDGRMLGFLGAIVSPYPRPQSYWLALWHVLPELKGGGVGGQLLQRMQDIALSSGGWIGTFGAGPEALPVYLKRGYAVRGVRRWVYDPAKAVSHAAPQASAALHSAEVLPPSEWIDYRFARHPIYSYEMREHGIFRTEINEWGAVSHACRLSGDWRSDVRDVYEVGASMAKRDGLPHLLDAWAFECPGGGGGWTLAPDDLPSVFHPPAARGNLIYAVGRPFIPTTVGKGDCDQDRPN